MVLPELFSSNCSPMLSELHENIDHFLPAPWIIWINFPWSPKSLAASLVWKTLDKFNLETLGHHSILVVYFLQNMMLS